METYFITNGIYRTAGTERVITQLASELEGVTIIVPGLMDSAFNSKNMKVISANIGDFPHSSLFLKLYHRYKYFLWLKKFFKTKGPRNVVSFSLDLNVLNIILSLSRKFKCIVCEHIEYNYHSNFLRRVIRKFFYRVRGVHLVCLTDTDVSKFKKDEIANVVKIPNFVFPVNSVYNVSSKRLLGIGRLEYQKNFTFLIESFILSKVYLSGWELHIFGEGSERSNLIKIIRDRNMSNFIKIHNFQQDLLEVYSNSAGLCMTSRFEAFPMVLLEAMNYSLPVLITDFPTGAREILGKDNPQIVRLYNEDVYAQELKNFCYNSTLRESYSAENKVLIKSYYPENIVDAWINLLKY